MIPPWLSEELAAGPISFERFMELALYHPTHGYYSANIKTVGRTGDFSTTATLSPTLARAIAHWIQEERKSLSLSCPIHLLELGPGDGSLARGVLAHLPWLIRRQVRLHLIEVSEPLRQQQIQSLQKHLKHANWHHDLKEALTTIPNSSHPLIYSNEFFDAFPVRVFQNDRELFLENKRDTLTEKFCPTSPIPPSPVFDHDWSKTQRLEVAESAQHWLQTNLADLRKASLLSIDYGGSSEEIYHRKPQGTLRGYLFQQLLTGPELFQNPGRCDLTADVNFDDLRVITEDLGFETLSYQPQSEFLTPHLVEQASADQFLSNPSGAGDAFKVLHQRKL